MTTQHIETLIVGAGQAGLATGYHLTRRGREFLIVDGNSRIGDNWRSHYDSLKLYSPAKFDGLPGMDFPGDPWHFPGKDEVADFLEQYAVDHGSAGAAARPGWIARPPRRRGFTAHLASDGSSATTSSSPPAPSVALRGCRTSRPRSRRGSDSSTPPSTRTRPSSSPGRPRSSVPRTPGTTSPTRWLRTGRRSWWVPTEGTSRSTGTRPGSRWRCRSSSSLEARAHPAHADGPQG